MNPRRALAASMLAWTALTLPLALPAQAQSASTHEVRRGDTLFGVARKARPDGVSRNQMILALWRAARSAPAAAATASPMVTSTTATPAVFTRDRLRRIPSRRRWSSVSTGLLIGGMNVWAAELSQPIGKSSG